jgi:hypothetical protein
LGHTDFARANPNVALWRYDRDACRFEWTITLQAAVHQLILVGNGNCTTVLAACAAGLPGVLFQGNLCACPVLLLKESGTMRGFLQQWSVLIAALLVVLSIVYTRNTIRTHTGGVNDRLSTLEKNIESIRNALEGDQGMAARIATLDLRVNEKLQNLIVQKDNYLEHNAQDMFNAQDTFQALKDTVDTIFTMTQRIEFVEEILLDMQASIESIRKQQNKETP